MLEDEFKLPVFINNDGNLFTLGEAVAGFLPEVNLMLRKGGSTKAYKNLFGITIGTGFGGGIVADGRMLIGDNSAAGEIWVMRNKLDRNNTAEEGVSIRALKRTYADIAGISFKECPEPAELYRIAKGDSNGDSMAAIKAFNKMGEIAGDALANAITLVDGLIVIGGGISRAYEFFLPRIIQEMNSRIGDCDRLEVKAFNLEDRLEREAFAQGQSKQIIVPGCKRVIQYDSFKRIGIGVSRLGTEKAICIGAYIFALKKLDGLL
jgi:glucokinase